MENRNSANYMEFEKTVKVRRRQIFPLNNLMRPENTPLFPTGEIALSELSIYCKNRLSHKNGIEFLPDKDQAKNEEATQPGY